MDNLTYETFIRRAWPCNRFEKGANTDTWESLRISEHRFAQASQGKKNHAERTYATQMEKVKKYVNKAYLRILQRLATNDEQVLDTFLDLKNRASAAADTQQLWEVLNDSFEPINQHKL